MPATGPKSVVITGGASGIGAAVAAKVTATGGHVAIIDINADAAAAKAKELGANATWAVANAADEVTLDRAHRELAGRMPPIDGLVPCAGSPEVPRPIEDMPVETWERIFDSHMKTTYVTCKVFGPAMAQRGHGAIVNISSVVGLRQGAHLAYGPAKMAIANLTQMLAVQWARKGLRVNAVAPGVVDTPFIRPPERGGTRDLSPILASTPIGRLLQPEEIAEVIYFLLSPAASAMTGSIVTCDGGFIAGTGWSLFGGVPQT
ncbi:MAG: SDR family oxidoreductase [Alphaproteobacteria bacterium]|nr:SDR family oxidoreductase [Alphaproteobacteria bacterium]